MNGLIDVRQVVTQIIGFLLMVWLLARYAWGPLMTVVDRRRAAIADEFDKAERLKAEAEALKARYDQEMRSIDAHARQKLQEAVNEGQKIAGEIKTQAHQDAQQRLERAGDEIAREREKAKEALKEQMITLSIHAAEKVLREKLGDATQRKLVGEFIDEVGATS